MTVMAIPLQKLFTFHFNIGAVGHWVVHLNNIMKPEILPEHSPPPKPCVACVDTTGMAESSGLILTSEQVLNCQGQS